MTDVEFLPVLEDYIRGGYMPIFKGHLVHCKIRKTKRRTRVIDLDLYTHSCTFDLNRHGEGLLRSRYEYYTNLLVKNGTCPKALDRHFGRHSIRVEVREGDVSEWLTDIHEILCDGANVEPS
jgi:hypothetical protein